MNYIDGLWLTDAELASYFMDELAIASRQKVPVAYEVAGIRKPTEQDFCVCGALTWAGLCEECQPVRDAVKQTTEPIQPVYGPYKPKRRRSLPL